MLYRCQGWLDRHPPGVVKAKKIFTASLTLNGLSLKKNGFRGSTRQKCDRKVSVLSNPVLLLASGICVWPASASLQSSPTLSPAWHGGNSRPLGLDLGDVILRGLYTPLNLSKRREMSETTNLLHKQEVSSRLGGKWWEGLCRASKSSHCLGLASPRLAFYIHMKGGMGKYWRGCWGRFATWYNLSHEYFQLSIRSAG